MTPGPPYWIRALPLLLCAALLSTCGEAVDAFRDDTAGHPFYLFGYLDTARDTQFVRIEAIRRPAEPAEAAPLDATVTSLDLETGQTVSWQDSLVQLDDGRTGHLFYARFTPQPAHHYHLTVRRGDGATTQARTEMPSRPHVRIEPEEVSGQEVTQLLTWEDVPTQPLHTQVSYRVASSTQAVPIEVVIPYEQRGQLTRAGWIVKVHLLPDRAVVRERLALSPGDTTAAFYGIRMDVALLSEAWHLAEDTGNVENGEGFFGSVGRFSVTWTLSSSVVAGLGFVNCQDSAAAIHDAPAAYSITESAPRRARAGSSDVFYFSRSRARFLVEREALRGYLLYTLRP